MGEVTEVTSELRMRLVPLNMFNPYSDFFADSFPRRCFFYGSFLLVMFHVCLCYAVLTAPCYLVITCWERTDLLALLCVVFSRVLTLSHVCHDPLQN